MQSATYRLTTYLRRTNPVQLFAWVYAVMFLGIAFLGYIPWFKDAQGYTFGLFSLELKDDALHLGSAIWAAVAAYMSVRASTLYFRIFGPVYMLDGIVGLFFGNAYLDGAIFTQGPIALDWGTRFFANLPHIVIGGTAVYIGYVVARQYASR